MRKYFYFIVFLAIFIIGYQAKACVVWDYKIVGYFNIELNSVNFDFSNYELAENVVVSDGLASLSFSCCSIVRVEYYTSNGKACHSFDYIGKSGFITFSSGQTSKTISIPIIGDTVYESQEEFYIHLVNSVNAAIQNAKGIGTIIDNDC